MTEIDEALLAAAAEGDALSVRRHIHGGARVDATNDHGSSALIIASHGGHADVVRALLEAGANLEMRMRSSGMTALHQAASQGHLEIARLLLAAGARVDAPDASNGTPLMNAAARRDLGLVRLLLESGAALNHRDADGFHAWAWAVDKGADEVASYLEQQGAETWVDDPDTAS
jgi:ankyrin repeat protein